MTAIKNPDDLTACISLDICVSKAWRSSFDVMMRGWYKSIDFAVDAAK